MGIQINTGSNTCTRVYLKKEKKTVETTSQIISDNLITIKLKVTLIELKICLINNTYLLPTFETFNISLVELYPCSFNSIQFGTLLA